MPREVSDAEWAQLQSAKQIAELAGQVWDDPALGPEAKALLKKKIPNLQIPDHDIRTEMRDGFDKIRKDREDERAADRQYVAT